MSPTEHLTADEIATLRSVAAVLIPGSEGSPAATELADFNELLDRAASALGAERMVLRDSLRQTPPAATWDQLADLAEHEPAAFEIISTTVSGAYFMYPVVLQSIGYPTGPRRAAPYGLIADELDSGILEPVMAWKPVQWLPPAETGQPAQPRVTFKQRPIRPMRLTACLARIASAAKAGPRKPAWTASCNDPP